MSGVDSLLSSMDVYDLRNVRSIHFNNPVTVRFINNTRRGAYAVWVGYDGKKKIYAMIEPGRHFEIRTFQTHPWVAFDNHFLERLKLNSHPILYPLRPGDEDKVLIVNLTTAVCPLKKLAMQRLLSIVPRLEDISTLGLPFSLRNEIIEYRRRVI